MRPFGLEEPDPLLAPRRGREEVDGRVDMTAMVDLVFMLNIFFLVTSAFAMMGELDLPSAKHVTAADTADSVVFTIQPTAGGEPTLFVGEDDERREIAGRNREQQIVEAVEAGLRDNKTSVIIKAPKGVAMREIAAVSRVAAVNEAVKIHLAVLEKD